MKTGARGRASTCPIIWCSVRFSITNLQVQGNITTRLKQISAYADDIVITGRTKEILIDTFCKL